MLLGTRQDTWWVGGLYQMVTRHRHTCHLTSAVTSHNGLRDTRIIIISSKPTILANDWHDAINLTSFRQSDQHHCLLWKDFPWASFQPSRMCSCLWNFKLMCYQTASHQNTGDPQKRPLQRNLLGHLRLEFFRQVFTHNYNTSMPGKK